MKWYDVKSPCLVNRFQFSRQIKTISISVAVSMWFARMSFSLKMNAFSLTLKPNQVMLNVMGKLLEASAFLVRFVTFDAHCAHQWFREAFFGTFETLKQPDLNHVPFFKDVEHRPLPPHDLPHFPVKLCFYDGLPMTALPGICFVFMYFRDMWFSSSGFFLRMSAVIFLGSCLFRPEVSNPSSFLQYCSSFHVEAAVKVTPWRRWQDRWCLL